MKAPGTCIQCGNDAYIRVAGARGGYDMVCAHCFGARGPQSGLKGGDAKKDADTKVPLLDPDPEIHRP